MEYSASQLLHIESETSNKALTKAPNKSHLAGNRQRGFQRGASHLANPTLERPFGFFFFCLTFLFPNGKRKVLSPFHKGKRKILPLDV